jgi:hypothetical protein
MKNLVFTLILISSQFALAHHMNQMVEGKIDGKTHVSIRYDSTSLAASLTIGGRGLTAERRGKMLYASEFVKGSILTEYEIDLEPNFNDYKAGRHFYPTTGTSYKAIGCLSKDDLIIRITSKGNKPVYECISLGDNS